MKSGALLEELFREAERLRFRRLSGQGPSEGWLPLKERLQRPTKLWQVIGGRNKGGILVREAYEPLGMCFFILSNKYINDNII